MRHRIAITYHAAAAHGAICTNMRNIAARLVPQMVKSQSGDTITKGLLEYTTRLNIASNGKDPVGDTIKQKA